MRRTAALVLLALGLAGCRPTSPDVRITRCLPDRSLSIITDVQVTVHNARASARRYTVTVDLESGQRRVGGGTVAATVPARGSRTLQVPATVQDDSVPWRCVLRPVRRS